MNPINKRQSAHVLLAVALLCVPGCGGESDSATVHGTVTFEGTPVEYGLIRFDRPDGKGFSAPIEGGEYSAPKATAGDASVTFIAKAKPPQVSSREELERTAGQPQPTVRQIPADHPEQGKSVEITPGSNELNFDL